MTIAAYNGSPEVIQCAIETLELEAKRLDLEIGGDLQRVDQFKKALDDAKRPMLKNIERRTMLQAAIDTLKNPD